MNDTPSESSPGSALDFIEELPPLIELGQSFMAVGPGADGVLVAHSLGTTARAQEALAEVAETTRTRLLKATPIAYGPVVLIPRQHVMHVGEDTAATLSEIQALVLSGDTLPFEPKADYAQSITMMAARFTTGTNDVVTFYRVAEPLLQFTKSKVMGFVLQGNQYDRLMPTDVLLMRAEFDVIVAKGQAFFFKKPTFERAFGFYDELKKASAATFDKVTASLRIKGLDDLRKACTSQAQMMAKMASIQRSMQEDTDYAAAMTMNNLISYIEEHPAVTIDLEGIGNDRNMVFDPSTAKRFQILKLLDDDFLRSVLTSREYEAGSKVRT